MKMYTGPQEQFDKAYNEARKKREEEEKRKKRESETPAQTYNPSSGTSTGMKAAAPTANKAKTPAINPWVQTNVPDLADVWSKNDPQKVEKNLSAKAPAKPAARPVNMYNSELYNKVVETKQAAAKAPKRNLEALTSAERGALYRFTAGTTDRFQETVARVKAGKVDLPSAQAMKRQKSLNFKGSEDFAKAVTIINRITPEEEQGFALVKEGRSILDGYNDSQDKSALNRRMFEIEFELQGQQAPEWKPEYSSFTDPDTFAQTLSNYGSQFEQAQFADEVLSMAEKLDAEAEWLERDSIPYAQMDEQERQQVQSETLLGFSKGQKPIEFNLPEEYLYKEQQHIDLNGMVSIAPGVKVPEYMQIADKNEREVREYADILRGILANGHGALGEQARASVEFELQHLDNQLTAIEGFRFRHENKNLAVDAQKGEELFKKDFQIIEDRGEMHSDETEEAFEARWAKALAASPNDAALAEQYAAERKAKSAARNRSAMGLEILAPDAPEMDYFLVPSMSEQERATYMAYYKNDKEAAHNYAMALAPELNKRSAFYMKEVREKLASGTFWEQGAAAGLSVLNTIGQIFGLGYVISKAARGEMIDPNAASFDPGQAKETYRAQLKENTKAAFGENSWETKVINFIQDATLGASDSIVGGKVLGFVGYMASGASQTVSSTLLRGGNQSQALLLAAANFGAEYITEKIPFDNLMASFKKGFTWRGLFVSVGGETIGEGLSSLMTDKADREIMLDKSEYEARVTELMAEGKTLTAAQEEANKETIRNALYEGLVGGASGGLSFGIGSAFGNFRSKDTTVEKAVIEQAADAQELTAAVAGVVDGYVAGANAPVDESAESEKVRVLQEQAAQKEAESQVDFGMFEAPTDIQQEARPTTEEQGEVLSETPDAPQEQTSVGNSVEEMMFPGDVAKQREYNRLLGGRRMSADAMLELAVAMEASQESGTDIAPNAAESAEIAARVKNMVALSGADNVSSAIENYLDSDSPAFQPISTAAAEYASGGISLAQAAERAYSEVMGLAKAEQTDAAQSTAATNAVQLMIGTYGDAAVKEFFPLVLDAVNGTDYEAQRQTMQSVLEAVLMPPEAASRQLLDAMIAGQAISPESLGQLNLAVEQDMNDPAYEDARASQQDELEIANAVAAELANGAMQDFDGRAAKIDGYRQAVESAQTEVGRKSGILETATAALQEFTQSMQESPATPELMKEHKTLVARVKEAQAQYDRAVRQHDEANRAFTTANEAYQSDYLSRLGEIRQRAIDASLTPLNAPESASTRLDDKTPVQNENPATGLKQGFNAMYATTTGYIPVTVQKQEVKGPVKSVQAIFTELGKKIGVPYNTNRRQYDRAAKGSAGYFVTKGEAVHVRAAQDLSAAAHEFGHYLDKKTRIGSHPSMQGIVAILNQNPQVTAKYTADQILQEAVAESVRMYMVNRDQAIDKMGTGFVTELEQGMRDIGVYDAFQRARAELGRTISASVDEEIKARIVRANEANRKGIKDRAHEFRIKAADATLAFDPISRRLRQILGKDYRASEDPRAIALKNNRVDNFVREIFESNLVDLENNILLGRGFADNFAGIRAEDIRDFEKYLLAYHELDRAWVKKSVFGNEYTPEQMQEIIRSTEAAHPEWKNNKAMLHEWYDAFMETYVVDQGIISKAEYATMKSMYPNYVPTYRQMEGGKDAGKGSSGDVAKGLKRAKGSDLNVISPIESMSRMVINYTRQAHQLQLGNVFADAIDNNDGMAMFAERVQTDIAFNKEIKDLKDNVQKIFENDSPDMTDMQEGILSLIEKSVFTASNKATGANVVNILGKDGNYRSYVVHDPNMFSLIQSLPATELSAILKGTGKLVRLVSATATGTNPFFAATNGIRDLVTQMIYGTTSTNIISAIPRWFANIPRTVMGALSNTTVNGKQILPDNRYTEAYRQYRVFSETGSRYAAVVGKSSDSLINAVTQQSKPKAIGRGLVKTFTLQFLNEMVENNTRFLEFYSGKSSLGKNIDNLNTFEGRLRAGLASAGVTVDFRRSGSASVMKEIAALVPFFNAGVQGINKAASVLTNENEGRRTQIVAKVALNMTVLGVAQALLNNMHMTDDEKDEYESFDDGMKAKSFFIKVAPEKLLRIPMPQDLNAMLSYALGRIIGSAVTGEGNSTADGFVNAVKGILTESFNFSTVYSPIKNIQENKTWYGGQIETSQMQKLATTQRYNERTTSVAKWMSENFGVFGLSPAQWDYIIPQYTGVWGKLGGNFLRNLAGDAGADEALVETLQKEMSSRFFTTPAYTSQLYNNWKASRDEFQQIQSHYTQDRDFTMLDPHLSQSELDTAVTEAVRMNRSGGELYEINKAIDAKWEEYGKVVGDESLTDEQRETQSVSIRKEINQLALKGQGIIADYEAKYFPGTARINQAVVNDGIKGLRAHGVEEAASMGGAVYEDFKAGKPYAQTMDTLAKKWGTTVFTSSAPSFNWDGMKRGDFSPQEQDAVTEAYTIALEQGITQNTDKLLGAGTLDEAGRIMDRIKAEATDRAKREAFGEKYWFLGASDYMVEQRDYNTKFIQQSVALAKRWDSDYFTSTVAPSFNWKGFDKEAASEEKIAEITDAYYDEYSRRLNQNYDNIMNANSREEALNIARNCSSMAGKAAKKVALRK